MTRSDAYQILTKHLHNKNLLKHCHACEVAMKALYKYLCDKNGSSFAEATADEWGITGLLHDVDYELAQTTNQLDKHGNLLFGDTQPKEDIPNSIKHAIQAHNYHNTKIEPQSDLDWAITCVDQLTGLIVACTLILPEKKLEKVDTDFVLKRMKQAAFARNVDRTEIGNCEEKLGIPLPEFVTITLDAMKTISTEIGL